MISPLSEGPRPGTCPLVTWSKKTIRSPVFCTRVQNSEPMSRTRSLSETDTVASSLRSEQSSSDHADNFHPPDTLADSLPQAAHYPNTISSYLHQISHSVDDDPFGERRRPITTTSLSDARQYLVEACIDYVFNSLPTHLLRVADMSILTRKEIWDSECSRIENILDEELRELRYEYSKGLAWHWTGFLERSWCEVSSPFPQ